MHTTVNIAYYRTYTILEHHLIHNFIHELLNGLIVE